MTELSRHIVVVLVFIRQDDRILLVRQNYGRRYWSLPGGVMELGESMQADHEIRECRFFPLDQLPQPIRGHLRDRVADFSQGQSSAVVRTQ